MTRPTPLHLKLLRGNPGRRPLRAEPEPPIEAKVPDPPAFLGGYAADEWHALAPHLHRLGLLTVLDTSCFAIYCTSYQFWREAVEALAAEAPTVSTDVGTVRPNPLMRVARDAAATMLVFAREFGLTSLARSRIGGAGYTAPRPPSKFDGLLNDGT